MSRTKWIGAAGLIGLLAGAGSAEAAPLCSSLPGPIYLAGSSAVQPIIAAMAVKLANQNPITHTIIYQSQGSCTGVNDVVGGTKITGVGNYYWGPSSDPTKGADQMCDLGAGATVDVGVSDVFGKTCLGSDLPAGFIDVPAFAQAMSFVVKPGSSQQAITAEEGYFTFGFGTAGMVTPWIDEKQLFIRNGSSGTQNIIAFRIGVTPATKMKGVDSGNTTGVLNNVTGAATNDAPIGIMAAETYDRNRDKLKSLAFRGFKQWFAYFADSTSTALDKRNVRDGHYLLWGYLHMVAAVDNNKVPTSPAAQQFFGWMTGLVQGPWSDISDLVTDGRGIPLCAMKVQISAEGGDFSQYTPMGGGCGCYFENRVNKAAPMGCSACQNDGGCSGSTPHCRRGFCEAN
jgi:ABC-type phosphate transport system substrate-binding protein